jgi:hypothetical protein
MKFPAFEGGQWLAGLALVAIVSIASGEIVAAGSAPPAKKGRRAEKTDGIVSVQIEILPGQKEKLIDVALPEAIPFVIMGRLGLEVSDLDPASLSLAGASVAKNEHGEAAEFRDVDGDGLPDLVARVYSRQMRIGEGTRRVSLSGRTRDGRSFAGTADLRTVQNLGAERRRAFRPDPASEKRPPMTVGIDILPGDAGNRKELGNRGTIPAAVLSAADFDATTLDPASLTLAGSPATRRGGKGGWGPSRTSTGMAFKILWWNFPNASFSFGLAIPRRCFGELLPGAVSFRGRTGSKSATSPP